MLDNAQNVHSQNQMEFLMKSVFLNILNALIGSSIAAGLVGGLTLFFVVSE